MKTFLARLLVLWLASLATAFGAVDATSLTPKELAQGFRDQRILAKPKSGHRETVGAAETREGLRLRRSYPRLGDLRVLELDATETVDQAIARLRATGRYEYVERDHVRHARVIPNDPSFSQQWALRNTGQSSGTAGADIAATSAWNTLTDASNVVVAVVDSGIRLTHTDLVGNLWSNLSGKHGINALNPASLPSLYYNPNDDDGHGTHVSGIIGAVGNNGAGIAGVAWSARIMALKFLNASGDGSSSDAVECIEFAIANGAQVINGSYGSSTYSRTEFDAIKAARDAGIVFVAAAGNDTLNNDTLPDYPSGYLLDNIVSVAATTRTDALATYSNYGSGLVDLAAPGSEIYSTYNGSDSDYQLASGTSMAAPHVTGALALLKAKFPTDTHRQLINRLLRATTPLTALSGKVQTGGRLNLALALASTSNLPFNDDFAARAKLSGANVRVRSSNAGATFETAAGEPAHAGLAGTTTSLWWTWTAPATSEVAFDTAGSSHDTVLALYTGDSLGALTPFAANDNANTSLTTSRILTNVTAGTTYHIAVAGKSGASGLTLLKIGSVPPNDNLASATALSGRNVQLAAINLNASAEAGEPTAPGGGGHSVWYKWTAPATGRYHLALFATEIDTTAAVYTGSTPASLSLVASNNNASTTNSDALVRFDATAGTTYYLQADNNEDDGAEGGNFTLTLTDSVWEFPVNDEITSSPAVGADGTVFIGSVEGFVYALNSDGTRKWQYPSGATAIGDIEGATPAVASDGTVYVGSLDNSLYALNGTTGAKKWSYAASSAIYAAAAIATDGTVYFRDDTTLYALTSAGAKKWSFPLNTATAGGTYCSPVIATDGTIYIGTSGGAFHALTDNGTSVSTKWSFTADGDVYTTPAIAADGTLYLGTLTGRFYALTPGATSATQKWSIALPKFQGIDASISSSPALGADGTVYFAGYDHKLYALNPDTGATVWSYPLGDEVRASSPAIAADGTVYVGVYDGLVYAVNADGTLQRTFPSALRVRSSPVIAGTRLYFGSADAKLHAFELGQGPAATAWPMYRRTPSREGRATGPLNISAQPVNQTVTVGGTATLSVTASATVAPTYQWQRNGANLAGATAASLTLTNLQPAGTGLYTAVVTSGTSLTTQAAIVGLATTAKVIGDGYEISPNTLHPNGRTFDQVLLTGVAEAITADHTLDQITRTSYVDLDNDIVQVEFSGPGTLSLVLADSSGPAAPLNYDQPSISYMKGHAGIVITGATEQTNVSVFTVGRVTAVNQALFKAGVNYDGIADIAFIAIASANGKFGGVRTANAHYFAAEGVTGIYAPGVAFQGPLFIGDLSAFESATPKIIVGSVSDARITGGELLQANGQSVEVSGLTQLKFTEGTDSHGNPLAAKTNQGVLRNTSGADVTAQIVVNPAP